MSDLDSITPQFRLATERWPEAPTLLNHYRAVSECYSGAGHGLIATVKSFIECVCLTILGEFGKPMPCSEPTTTELLVEALKPLGLENTRGASRVDKLLSAHNRMADALSEMRNVNDPVAHGRDGFLDALTVNECRAFLITADTILALLLSAHDGKEPNLQYTREPYDRFGHLNDRIDRAVTLEAAVEDGDEGQVLLLKVRAADTGDETEIRVPPSKVLYALDRTAYVGFLASSPVQGESPQPSAEPFGAAEAGETMHAPEPAPPTPEVVRAYQGLLLPLKGSFDEYLESLGLPVAHSARNGANVSDSLLATAEQHMGLDWTEREPLQAGMKVALRRTLIQFGVAPRSADETASHLVSWLKIQAVGLGEAAGTGGKTA
jgi:hypothetical protein